MKGQTEAVKNVSFVQVVEALPPYMKAEKWGLLVGKTTRAVKDDLQKGIIARYQPVADGLVYVNVAQEVRKTETAKAY